MTMIRTEHLQIQLTVQWILYCFSSLLDGKLPARIGRLIYGRRILNSYYMNRVTGVTKLFICSQYTSCVDHMALWLYIYWCCLCSSVAKDVVIDRITKDVPCIILFFSTRVLRLYYHIALLLVLLYNYWNIIMLCLSY